MEVKKENKASYEICMRDAGFDLDPNRCLAVSTASIRTLAKNSGARWCLQCSSRPTHPPPTRPRCVAQHCWRNDDTPVASTQLLYYLSGLTCSDENVITKAGAQRRCAQHGIALVAPDTSPRNLGVEGEAESWDFGVGAGFYVDATQPKWKQWRMYSYVTKELPELLKGIPELDVSRVRCMYALHIHGMSYTKQSTFHDWQASITGHSMGGHGALVLGLRHPDLYRSISAFAPICNPMDVPWGNKGMLPMYYDVVVCTMYFF